MHPGSRRSPIPDEDLEWAVRLALECRRRVKEQQKRIGSAEFRNTQFSYTLGKDGVEKFVVTPELQSETTLAGSAAARPGLDHQPRRPRRRLRPVPHRGQRRGWRRRQDPESACAAGIYRERPVCRAKPLLACPRTSG